MSLTGCLKIHAKALEDADLDADAIKAEVRSYRKDENVSASEAAIRVVDDALRSAREDRERIIAFARDNGADAGPQPDLQTEITDQGKQTLVPGVAPITDRQRLQSQMDKPLRGRAAAPPAGGLFDEDARNQTDLVDMIRAAPARESTEDVFAHSAADFDRRRALVEKLLQGPGDRWVLVNKNENMGAIVAASPEGGWRVTRFDQDGFVGHTDFHRQFEALESAVLDEHFEKPGEDVFRRMASNERFQAGNEAFEKMHKDLASEKKPKVGPTKEAEPRPGAKVDPKDVKRAQKLRATAEKSLARAKEKFGQDRNTNTARRARMAASAEADAQYEIQIAETAIKIADAIEAGEAGPLANVSSIAQVKELNRALHRAKIASDKDLSYVEKQHREGRPAEESDLDHVKLEPLILHEGLRNDLVSASTRMQGLGDSRRRIQRMTGDVARVTDPDDIYAARVLANAVKEKEPYDANRVLSQITERDRLTKLGIDTDKKLQEALRAFAGLQAGKAKADPIKEAERALIGRKIPGFFQTPVALAENMVESADVKQGDKVLEPNGGAGRIADALASAVGIENVAVIEPVVDLQNILKAKGHNVVGTDFLEHEEGGYDAIVMNPPFENNQDIEHVRHAYKLVKPGGRVVAIMGEGAFSRGYKTERAFRQWLADIGGTDIKNPEGTFKESGTGVATRLVLIEKTAGVKESRFSPRDYERILSDRRALEGLRAAIRDPKTGKIYTGSSHQAAINRVPPSDETGAWGRLQTEWDQSTENTGFVDNAGNFISREEAEKKWDVLTMEDVRDRIRESRSRKTQSRAAKSDVVAAVKQVVEQMAPAAKVDVVHRLLSPTDGETTVSGIQFLDYIAVSLDGGVPAARHEVIHFLKEAGLFTEQEWSILERNADKWMDKHGIREAYPDLADNPLALKEEAIAEEFANSGDTNQTPFVKRMFERIREFFERVTNALRGLGYQNATDIFEKVESGEVGRRPTPAQAARAKRGEIKESRKKKPTNPDLARVQAAAKAKMEREQAKGKPHEEDAQGSLHAAEMATLPESAKREPEMSAKAKEVAEALPFTPFHTPPHIKQVFKDRSVSHLSRVRNSLPLAEDVLRLQLQDRYIYTRRLQEQVQDREGGPLPEAIDGYVWLRLFPGKTGRDLVRLEQDVIEPIIEMMNEKDVSIDELDLYLYAKWAPRANELVAAINKEFPDGGSGMTNADAKAIIDGFRAAGKEKALQDVAKPVYAMIHSRVKMLYRHGIIPKAVYHAWMADPEYVPLRGFADDTVAEFIEEGKPKKGTGAGRGHDIRYKEVARLGRKTRARDIFETIVGQAERAIVVSHKNDATKALYKFAQKYPDPAVWETKARRTRLVKSKETGMVQVIPDLQYVKRDHVIGVMIDGKQHFLTIHHPNIAPALKNMGAQEIQWAARVAQYVNRVFAFIYTSASPNFIMSNAFRDFEEALVNMQEFDVKGLAKDVARDWIGLRRRGIIFTADFKALRAGYKAIKGKTSTDPDVQAFIDSFNEYWAAGGKVEFFSLRDMEKQKKRIANLMADVNPSNIRKMRLFATNVVKLISDINGAVENHVRFLTYHHLRKRGFSQQSAAFLVRNLTVDFNLKGMAGPYISAFYLFYNAQIQSMARQAHAVIRPKPPQNYLAGAPGKPRSDKKVRNKMRMVLGTIILSGLANDLLNGLFLSAEQTVGYDDDDDDKKKDRKKLWDQLPENYKQRYMIWGNPYAEDKPGTSYGPGFMLPYGYSFFHRMGMLIGEVLRGATPPEEAAMTLMGAFFTSFNPLGSHEMPLMIVVPQILKAPVELGINVDWTGKPIVPPENVFQPWKRNVDRYWGSVSEPAKGIANFLYEGPLGDGNSLDPAIADISPEHIEYIWNTYTGGLGTFMSRSASGITDFVKGNDVKIKDVPFIGTLSMSESAAWEYDKYGQIRNRVMAYRDGEGEKETFDGKRAYRKRYPVEAALIRDVMGSQKALKKHSKAAAKIRHDSKLTEKQKEDALWGTEERPGPNRYKLEIMRKVIRKWENLEKLR